MNQYNFIYVYPIKMSIYVKCQFVISKKIEKISIINNNYRIRLKYVLKKEINNLMFSSKRIDIVSNSNFKIILGSDIFKKGGKDLDTKAV